MEEISWKDMKPGRHYVVVKPSKDKTFRKGDHVEWWQGTRSQYGISCREAQGWIDGEDLEEAAEGMTVTLDTDWAKDKLASLKKQITYLKMNSYAAAAARRH